MRYFFIFGREPELSRAELMSKFKIEKINSAIIGEGDNFVIADVAGGLDVKKFIGQLGGTVKIGSVEQKTDKFNEQALFNLLEPQTKKFNFGISAYGFNPNINELGIKIKKLLSADNKKSRFVASKKYPLSSVIVQKELLKNGVELALLKTNGKFFIGQTTAVQPFEEFSALDYGRPARDPRSGMLPPKLATMMLNLSETEKDKILLDPFCGSGTVLQQALILGYRKVIGADASPKAVQSTQKNIQWLSNRLRQPISCDIKQAEIKTLPAILGRHSVDAIVTEPYLGPTLKSNENNEKMKLLITELKRFYQIAFDALFDILKPNGMLIVVVPELHANNTIYRFNINLIVADKFKITERWHYQRPNQFVGRQIFKMIKTNN